MRTLLDVLLAAPGGRTALILPETGTCLTHDALRERVRSMAAGLRQAGIVGGARVAIALPNGLDAIVAFLAASLAGTAAPLNPAYKYEEFCFFLEDTAARLLIAPAEGAEEARRAAAARGIPVVTPDIAAAGPIGYAGNRDTIGAAAGIGALVLSFAVIRLIDRRVKVTGQFEPVISQVVGEEMAEAEAGACCSSHAR
jgi:hypothetical protein